MSWKLVFAWMIPFANAPIPKPESKKKKKVAVAAPRLWLGEYCTEMVWKLGTIAPYPKPIIAAVSINKKLLSVKLNKIIPII